jgi:hypothetical protein
MSVRPPTDADGAPPPGPALERAATVLGVAPDAPHSARAALLRRLPAAGLVPPPEWRAAVRTLTGQPARGPGALADPFEACSADDALRSEIEAFASSFWSYAPAERRRLWRHLLGRCAADPPLVARLGRLEAGVDLEPAAPGGGKSRTGELAGMVQALIVLKPAERAARRRQLLAGLRAPACAWQAAARQLREQHPAIAALEPVLVERVGALSRPAAAASVTVAGAGPSWGFRTQGGLRAPRAPQRQRPAGSATGAGGLILIVILVVNIVTRLASSGSHPAAPRYNLPPPYTPSVPTAPVWPPPGKPADKQTIEDLLRPVSPRNPPAADPRRWIPGPQPKQTQPSGWPRPTSPMPETVPRPGGGRP